MKLRRPSPIAKGDASAPGRSGPPRRARRRRARRSRSPTCRHGRTRAAPRSSPAAPATASTSRAPPSPASPSRPATCPTPTPIGFAYKTSHVNPQHDIISIYRSGVFEHDAGAGDDRPARSVTRGSGVGIATRQRRHRHKPGTTSNSRCSRTTARLRQGAGSTAPRSSTPPASTLATSAPQASRAIAMPSAPRTTTTICTYHRAPARPSRATSPSPNTRRKP